MLQREKVERKEGRKKERKKERRSEIFIFVSR
jgi:hypothetical protein